MPHTARRAAAALALAAWTAAIPATAGAVAPNARSVRSGPRPFFDSRARANASSGNPARTLPATDRAARKRLARDLGPQAALVADPVTGTPRSFGRLDGALTGPQAGDAADVAMRYVRANTAALGLTSADLSTLRLAARDTANGVTHLRWRQQVDGIPAFDNELRVNVDGDGRVINILGAPRHALSVASTTPQLSAPEALAALARNVGSTSSATVTAGPAGPRRQTMFSTGDRARLVLFGDVSAVRLAWHLTFRAAPNAWYDAVVDATTGRVLRRVNLTKGVDALVFEMYPGAPLSPDQINVTLDQYLTGGASATTLSGPFAHAWSDLNDAPATDVPSLGEEVTPGSYPFTDFTTIVGAAGGCDPLRPPRCSWDHRDAASWSTNRRQNAVQAFWYANHFHDHLAAGPIGFTPAQGNFAGDDPVLVETDDGANGPGGLPDGNHVDNANMSTPPNGQSPVMQMYLFKNDADSPFRDVNGGDDASVVYHEYTHGLSSRLITDADGVAAVNTAQAGAMGEAWSDWYAKDFLVNEGVQPDNPTVPGEVDMGEYVDATPNQIRNEPLDCPVGTGGTACPGTPTAGPGGFTYGDFGNIGGRGPEVHDDGEIWGETLWDLRDALGFATTEQLVTDAMRLSPPEPSFLEERNAILQADAGGLHADAIWQVFANRGMGFFAGTTDSTDPAPVEDTRLPPPANGPTGRITGRAFDSGTGAPLAGIAVGIGGLNTLPSAFTAVTDANGNYTIGPVPVGTYPVLTFQPPTGYDRFSAAVTVTADTTVTADAPIRRDWATTTAGAAVAFTNDNVFAPACGTNGALDLDRSVGWSAFNQNAGGSNPHPGEPPTATIRLPQAVNVSAFGVNPTNTCRDEASAATRDLRIEVSSDGATFTPVMTPRFDATSLRKLTTLPVASPVANVRFVRITMLSNQLPAGAPATADGQFFTDLTEFEVFGAPPAPAAAPPAGGAGAPAPATGTSPAPAPQPGSGTTPTQAVSRPTGAIAASRTRGRATFTVGCSLACRATATTTVSRATARRLRLSSARLARVTRSLTAAGRRTFPLNVSAATLRRIRARGVQTVTATVAVTIRDARNQTRTVRRAVRIRVR
jgi:extracellular elastinolytic metalloproteinase